MLKVQAEDCLVDGKKVELTGTTWRETFPGPSNYKSIENGDKPQTYHKKHRVVVKLFWPRFSVLSNTAAQLPLEPIHRCE
ncbi:MAG: hypothetical protein JAY74_28975, partial [Candidatus Thiodiazotropha taylori]|nr:hypothetical protein [Candidatus Thiodiazotropha taylori]